MPTSNPRRFRGFVAIEREDGPLVWGTFRTTEAEARAAFERWNPALPDMPPRGVIVPVEIQLLTR